MDVKIEFSFLLTLLILSTSMGHSAEGIRNCRKYFHRVQKRSEDGHSFLHGYEISGDDERVERNCTVYDLTPPPATALPKASLTPTPDEEHRQLWPAGAQYYVFPVLYDPAGDIMYSAVKFSDMRVHTEGTQAASIGDGTRHGQTADRSTSLQSLLAQGKLRYIPPRIVSGKDVNVRWLIANGATLRQGFSQKSARVIQVPKRDWLSSFSPGFVMKSPGGQHDILSKAEDTGSGVE